jgi:hypothetical protein
MFSALPPIPDIAVMGHELIGDPLCERMIEAASNVDRGQFLTRSILRLSECEQFCSVSMSASA